ncbi:hypothetical protein WS72_24955 [Burkholderia savannae]|uniref:Uncharacterized protein n=1 Tax=Burkholderia savannae TaxID=1637837 RepID=A0ABR5T4I8_9BURK|nr:hypothetical protein WS72_24955 [Burkholderia savannae]
MNEARAGPTMSMPRRAWNPSPCAASATRFTTRGVASNVGGTRRSVRHCAIGALSAASAMSGHDRLKVREHRDRRQPRLNCVCDVGGEQCD